MFTQKCCARAISGCASAPRLTQISTVGGSAETLANAFTVNPCTCSSCVVVTIATPVAKRRIAARKSSVDAGTESDPVADRNDRRVELRVVEERLVEGAQRLRVLVVAPSGRGRRASRPEEIVDDDDPRA